MVGHEHYDGTRPPHESHNPQAVQSHYPDSYRKFDSTSSVNRRGNSARIFDRMVLDEGRLNGGCRSVNGAGVEERDRWLGMPGKIGRVAIFPLLPIELADDQPDVQESVGVHALPFRLMAAWVDAAMQIWIWVAKTARSENGDGLRIVGSVCLYV
ncbi:hypothetical protein ACLOJK_036382 [Asimina triloba]